MKDPVTIEQHGTMAVAGHVWTGDSASRLAMLCSQLSQALVLDGSEPSHIQHGFEDQLTNHTFGAVAHETIQVITYVEKYPVKLYNSSLDAKNPLVTMIYQVVETGEFGSMDIIMYQNQKERIHETFSYNFRISDELGGELPPPESIIKKGTKITVTPSHKDGHYSNGVRANAAFINLHATIEDGFLVSESLAKRMTPLAYATRSCEFGKKQYPLNLYGDAENYRPFPRIGERIRDDGLVFALRTYDDNLDFIEMAEPELMIPDRMHDKTIYGEPGAIVRDITIHSTVNEFTSNQWGDKISDARSKRSLFTPEGMETLAEAYCDTHTQYYDKILREYDKIVRSTRGKFKLEKEFSNLIVTALGQKPNTSIKRFADADSRKNTIRKTLKATPIDEWMVEVFYTYDFEVDLGAKITNGHGGKGVFCKILPDKEMPVDKYGNVVDVCIFSKGAFARLNPGQYYEQFINAVRRDVYGDICFMMGEEARLKLPPKALEECRKESMKYCDLSNPGPHNAPAAMSALMSLLEVASPRLHEEYLDEFQHAGFEETAYEVIPEVIRSGIYLLIPSDSKFINPDLYTKLMAIRPPNKSTLTMVTELGEVEETLDPCLIGEIYYYMLEKLDHKPMAVSGALKQHHGLPAKQTKATKHSRPSKEQSIRVFGESEYRLLAAVAGEYATAMMSDVATNASTQQILHRRLVTADNPNHIDTLYDPGQELGGRPKEFVTHLVSASGAKFCVPSESESRKNIFQEIRSDNK